MTSLQVSFAAGAERANMHLLREKEKEDKQLQQ
jgi:hypothetical protein